MIRLNEYQTSKDERSQTRDWIGRMAEAWYDPENPSAETLKDEEFVRLLQSIALAAANAGLRDPEGLSLFGFVMLRCTCEGWARDEIQQAARFFLVHAVAGNALYAYDVLDVWLHETE